MPGFNVVGTLEMPTEIVLQTGAVVGFGRAALIAEGIAEPWLIGLKLAK
jgi:hypothetical protein